MVNVEKLSATNFIVTVDTGTSVTNHRVTLSSSYHRYLTGGNVSPELLVQSSFEFLLERENNSSILPVFDLPAIQTHFPEYEEVMKAKLK